MRVRYLALSLALSTLPTPSPAQSAREANAPTPIVVAASHTIRVAADRATIHVLVEGTAETADLARQRLNEKVATVRRAIVESGLAAESPTDVVHAIVPTPTNSGSQWPAGSIPFTTRATIRVNTGIVDKIAVLVAAALTAGATASSTPQFEYTRSDSVRASAIPMAMQRARRDAEAVALGLDGSLGEPLEVSVFGANTQQSSPLVYFNARYDTGAPAQLPEVSITATVNVRYRFVPRQ